MYINKKKKKVDALSLISFDVKRGIDVSLAISPRGIHMR